MSDPRKRALWDAIAEYVAACGGSTAGHGTLAMMKAVVKVESAVLALIADLVERPPSEPKPVAPRTTRLPLGVRRVKGGVYQSRAWVGPGRSAYVNLGLFHPARYGSDEAAIAAAAAAVSAFKKEMGPNSDVWEVVKALRLASTVPPDVLPPLVLRVGCNFGVRGRSEAETYSTPEAAWASVREDFLNGKAVVS